MTRLATLSTSFRGRFLLVVFFAAVVPLALIGVWLTGPSCAPEKSAALGARSVARQDLGSGGDAVGATSSAIWGCSRTTRWRPDS